MSIIMFWYAHNNNNKNVLVWAHCIIILVFNKASYINILAKATRYNGFKEV